MAFFPSLAFKHIDKRSRLMGSCRARMTTLCFVVLLGMVSDHLSKKFRRGP